MLNSMLLAAQNNDAVNAAVAASVVLVAVIVGLVALAVAIFVIYLLYSCYARLPQEYQPMAPGLVWLLLIPLFNIVWQFFVVLRLSKAYQTYFAAQNRTDVGDCGYMIGLIALICGLLGWIPVLGILAGIAGLVLWIVYLVKVVGLRNQIAPGTQLQPV